MWGFCLAGASASLSQPKEAPLGCAGLRQAQPSANIPQPTIQVAERQSFAQRCVSKSHGTSAQSQFQCGLRLFPIVEVDLLRAQNLIILMPLARN
jgi:hypothetical protein